VATTSKFFETKHEQKMILLDKDALQKCIKDAIREELNHFGDIRKGVTTQQEKPTEKLLTKKEMAEELDISLVSLTDWMKQGRLPYLRMGKRVYFKKDEVLASMKNFHHKGGMHDSF